jgi:hypothetical protein
MKKMASLTCVMATVIFALLMGSSGAAWAATEYKVLHNFGVEDSDG